MLKRGKIRETGYRSKLEERVAATLSEIGEEIHYEVDKVKYIVPESNHTYKIDFTLSNDIKLEVKGCLRDHEERYKYKLVKEQNPDIDLRFVFDNPRKKVPGTKMTHAEWADKEGFQWVDWRDRDKLSNWIKENNKCISK